MDTTKTLLNNIQVTMQPDSVSTSQFSQFKKCIHEVYEYNCTHCRPYLKCIHGGRTNKCIKCMPRLLCPHGNHKYKCAYCVKNSPYNKKVVEPKVPRKCIHGVIEVGCYTCIQNSLTAQYFKDFHEGAKK